MAYYVGIDMEDKCLIKDIKDSGYFGRNYKYKEKDACLLEEIDDYTTRFNSEPLIKRCLLSEKIIREDEIDKPLVIMHIDGFLDEKGSMGRKVYGNILTKKSRNYLKNPQEIVSYIENRINEMDLLFFSELRNILPNDTALKSVITNIEYIVQEMACNDSFDSIELNMLNEILLSNKISNYEVYHNIVSFIADYDDYLSKKKEDIKVRSKKQ